MDQIQFSLVAKTFNDEPNEALQISVECFINDKLIVEWDDLPIDILVLKESTIKSGNYCIWTCTCGIPACGGVSSKGITITHEQNKIIWTNLNYPLEGIDKYEFNKEMYITAINKVWKKIKAKYFELKRTNQNFEFCPNLKNEEILKVIYK